MKCIFCFDQVHYKGIIFSWEILYNCELKSCSVFLSSYHLNINIDTTVTAVLSIFTAVMKCRPAFRAHGGSLRENLALQNVQVRGGGPLSEKETEYCVLNMWLTWVFFGSSVSDVTCSLVIECQTTKTTIQSLGNHNV